MANPAKRPGLTQREIEVLQLTADGKNETDIAQLLGISRYTIHNHRTGIRRRLDANTMAHAVNIGWERGLLHA